jgi:UDP-glucose 4-epimerase
VTSILAALPDTVSTAISSAYSGSTILISGGRGYLGSALAEAFTEIDCRLILLDRSPANAWQPQAGSAQVNIANGDVTKAETWERFLPEVDYVFHLAGLEYIHRSTYDALADLQASAASVWQMVETWRKTRRATRIVFSSSANLFGKAAHMPVDENAPSDPLTPWAVHKLVAEQYLRISALEHQLKAVSLRLANIYGPTPRKAFIRNVVLNHMIARALEGNTLTVFNNHNHLRDFLFIDDAIRAFLLAGLAQEILDGRVIVVGSGRRNTIDEVWRLVAERVEIKTGKSVNVCIDDKVELGISEMRDFVADTTQFESRTGWKPQIDLPPGIDLTIDSLTSGRII